jgi:hypothetical protein
MGSVRAIARLGQRGRWPMIGTCRAEVTRLSRGPTQRAHAIEIQRAHAIEMRSAGKSLQEIGDVPGVSRMTIWRHTDRASWSDWPAKSPRADPRIRTP